MAGKERRIQMKYSIDRWQGDCWLWAGDGDTTNGCFADIPDAVLERADEGRTGEMEAEGETYRISQLD